MPIWLPPRVAVKVMGVPFVTSPAGFVFRNTRISATTLKERKSRADVQTAVFIVTSVPGSGRALPHSATTRRNDRDECLVLCARPEALPDSSTRNIDPLIDDGSPDAMTRRRHRRVGAPGAGGDVVHLVLLEDAAAGGWIALAAEDVDAIAEDRGGQPAAGGGEGSERAPAIGGGIVDFHRREIPFLTPADHEQLSAGGDSGEMLARSGHRGQRVPLIRERIIDLEQTSVRRSADRVDPAVDHRSGERASRREKRRDRRPEIRA